MMDKVQSEQFNSSLGALESQLRGSLLEFDKAWTKYEQYYVYELMVIETDARRFVIQAIGVEKQMTQMEIELERQGEDLTTNQEYNEVRQQLLAQVAQVNTICNMNGKGRDDLTDVAILQAAEQIPETLLTNQARSIQALSEKIRQSIRCFRVLLRRYAENIDSVDPQMKNNKELCEVVEIYENSWTLGKEQLLESSSREQIINFCINIETLCEKYSTFREQVESSEAEIFLSIPSLMILKSIQNDKDSHIHHRLCTRFCPTLDLDQIQSHFNGLQGDKVRICQKLEEFIIHDDEKYLGGCEHITAVGHKIKQSGMELSRSDAQEFNQFITAALGE